jgi:hypothetical protein
LPNNPVQIDVCYWISGSMVTIRNEKVRGSNPLGSTSLRSERSVERRLHWIVPVEGLEPPRPHGHQILSLARLPIPPHRQVLGMYYARIKLAGKIVRQSLETDVFSTAKLQLLDFTRKQREQRASVAVPTFAEARQRYEQELDNDPGIKPRSTSKSKRSSTRSGSVVRFIRVHTLYLGSTI